MSGMPTSLRPASPATRLLALSLPRLRRGQGPDRVGRVRVPLGVVPVVAGQCRAPNFVDVRTRRRRDVDN